MPTAPGRIPTTVVTGAAGSGKSRLIAQLRARRPHEQRWALLTNSVGRVARPLTEAVSGDEYFPAGGGCACCIAGPAFRTALVRLLRAGPWEHLHIEVDPAGHPHRLVDQLRTPPFDRYLSIDRLLLTLRDTDYPLPFGSGQASAREDMLAASSRLGLATDFLLWSQPGSGLAEDLAPRLQSAPPWPRLERIASCPGGPTTADVPWELPGWRVFSAAPLQHAPAGSDIVRQWPAEAVGERRPLKSLLASFAAIDAVTGFQALFRTPRAWYRWGFGHGGGEGPLGFDDGRELVESETAWRLDNRFCLWLEPGTGKRQLQEVGAQVDELQQALEGAADAYRSGLHAYRA